MYASDLKHPTQTLEDKLHQLYALNRDKALDLGFREPFIKLLKAFGQPHLHLPPVIHVAGTNGKGSIIAMLRAMLEAQGYKVHAYTSPHLECFNERIVLAGQEIKNIALEELIDEALDLNADGDVTFFEITTAMAFAAFSRVPADICLLEVGMGGRLDCTNVIEKPLATVISTVGLDHMEHLGENLQDIAAEKAGIIKDQVPCIIGAQKPEALKTMKEHAKEKSAALYACDADWIIEPFNESHMRFIYRGEDMLLPRPTLQGAHQILNAGAALATLKMIKDTFPVSFEAMTSGLKNASWRARFQPIKTGSFIKDLPEGWDIYLDGGHNADAGKALAQSVSALHDQDPKDCHLILGMMPHKDPETFLESLRPHLKTISIVPIPWEKNCLSTFEGAQSYDNIQDAFDAITQKNLPGRILIAGSLYLAGHVLASNSQD